MANYVVTDQSITSVANAIRTKGGTTDILHWPNEFVSAIIGIPTGGGGATDVIFIDYDGTIVATKSKADISAMTSDSDLPANPTHTGLTAQGWNWTVAQLKAQLTAMPDQKVYVGQMYITESKATEIDVVMHKGRLDPILTICVDGEVTVDWGDNTTFDTITGTSETTRLEVNHTYVAEGNYTISISNTSGTYRFWGDDIYSVLRKNANENENRTYSNCVRAIRLGNGMNTIGSGAFCNCHSLASITIPNNITRILSQAFQKCYSLTNVTIPSDVTSIGTLDFGNCFSLASIAIPGGVTTINSTAFNSCYSLANITIPNGVTSIGNAAFQSCYSLTNVTIPSDVTSIGNNCCYSCYSLVNFIIPSNVTSIGSNAFNYCYSLVSITIPSSVTSIKGSAFAYCFSLENIIIPSDITSIGNNTFSYCYSLANITIPSNVTSIGNSAFANCYGMAEYHFLSTTPPTLGTTAFTNIPSDCIIYVPYSEDHSILNAYQTATNWATYASYIYEEPAP